MTLNELYAAIRQWASDRNLILGSDPKSQMLKFVSEMGEIFSAKDHEERADAIGDSAVVLTILAAQLGRNIEDLTYPTNEMGDVSGRLVPVAGLLADAILKNQRDLALNLIAVEIQLLKRFAYLRLPHYAEFQHCVESAYNEIKDRKGVMYNNAFIKESDPAYPAVMTEMNFMRKNGLS